MNLTDLQVLAPGTVCRFTTDSGRMEQVVLNGMTCVVVKPEFTADFLGTPTYRVKSIHGKPEWLAYSDQLTVLEVPNGRWQPGDITPVRNLATGITYHYFAPPKEAVYLAYMQGTLGDHNWWNYHMRKDVPPVEAGEYTVMCGDWCAFTDRCPINW